MQCLWCKRLSKAKHNLSMEHVIDIRLFVVCPVQACCLPGKCFPVSNRCQITRTYIGMWPVTGGYVEGEYYIKHYTKCYSNVSIYHTADHRIKYQNKWLKIEFTLNTYWLLQLQLTELMFTVQRSIKFRRFLQMKLSLAVCNVYIQIFVPALIFQMKMYKLPNSECLKIE